MSAFYEEGFNEELSVSDGLWALLDTNCDHPVNVKFAGYKGTIELVDGVVLGNEHSLIMVAKNDRCLAYLDPDLKFEYLNDVIQWILAKA